MKSILFIIFLLFSQVNAWELKPEQWQKISNFVRFVQMKDTNGIASFIRFPFARSYPIPPIVDSKDFFDRFDNVFDNELLTNIAISKISETWAQMGWRGIMFGNGSLWMYDDCTIQYVSFHSESEKVLRQKIIDREKTKLHESLRNYKRPILEWETRNFIFRVDEIGSGYKYRYSAWPTNSSRLSLPSLILTNGTWIPDGSGGNHRYEFTNGNYLYRIFVTVIGAKESFPGSLMVFKDGKEILSESIEKQKSYKDF